MSGEKKIFWTVVAVAVAVVAALVALPRVEERVAPQPTAAWVGIEVEGSGVARVGPVTVEAGTPFMLHAVLAAETRRGETIYYTEAPALSFGEQAVAAEALRRWPSDRPAKGLWVTVVGPSPYVELPGGSLERFRLAEHLRSDWPFAWRVRGRLEPANDDAMAPAGADAEHPFGTQRFQVRIELFGREATVLPEARFASWGHAELPARLAEFPTVTAHLPGPARPASEAFGLTQLEASGEGGASGGVADLDALRQGGSLRESLVELTRQRLAFSRLPLLAEVLAAAGVSADAVPWQPVELTGARLWGQQVHAGDLVSAGGRVVVLYRDAAPAAPVAEGAVPAPAVNSGPGNGRLDGDDLALDYVRGASVRRLSEVFDLTAGGTLSWAPIGRPAGE
jgi:hypothetical protein